IARRATQEDQAVDRARAPQHLASWPTQAAAIEMGFGFRLIAPVDAGVGHQLAKAQGYVDPRIAVAPAGLDQTQGNRRVLRQPRCQHASCRAPTSHHHIEFYIEILSQDGTSHCRSNRANGVPHSLETITNMTAPFRLARRSQGGIEARTLPQASQHWPATSEPPTDRDGRPWWRCTWRTELVPLTDP